MPRPHIQVPGDELWPLDDLAVDFGISTRTLRRNPDVGIVYIGGVAYAKKSRNPKKVYADAVEDAEATAQGAAMTKPQTTKRPVHPIADLFPMMTDEELANLAADIKANGLIHPIVVDKDGLVIDGRNRARACEIAGIEPTTVPFDGDDPRAYIIAANISRRHLTKGQQAMAVAMIYPVPEKGGRGKKKTMDETSTLFSPKRLQLARTVLAHSSDLAQAVLAGSKFLDAAYDEARKARSRPPPSSKVDEGRPPPRRLPRRPPRATRRPAPPPRTAPAIPKIIVRRATELRRSS